MVTDDRIGPGLLRSSSGAQSPRRYPGVLLLSGNRLHLSRFLSYTERRRFAARANLDSSPGLWDRNNAVEPKSHARKDRKPRCTGLTRRSLSASPCTTARPISSSCSSVCAPRRSPTSRRSSRTTPRPMAPSRSAGSRPQPTRASVTSATSATSARRRISTACSSRARGATSSGPRTTTCWRRPISSGASSASRAIRASRSATPRFRSSTPTASRCLMTPTSAATWTMTARRRSCASRRGWRPPPTPPGGSTTCCTACG